MCVGVGVGVSGWCVMDSRGEGREDGEGSDGLTNVWPTVDQLSN